MRRLTILIAALVMSFVLLAGACAPTPKQESAADFYKNNAVTIVVTFPAGGGVDFGARMLANYWAEVTGGPPMKVENKEGAGGLVGMNYVYATNPDGLTIGTTNTGNMTGPVLLSQPGVEFQMDKFNWLGLMTENPAGFALGKGTKYETMADLQAATETLLFGSIGPTHIGALGGAVVAEVFGLENMKVVNYPGTEDEALAAARGEIHGYAQGLSVFYDHVRRDFSKPPLLTLAAERSEWFPDAPALGELVKMTPEYEKWLRIVSGVRGGNIFYAPPGVPADRVKFLQDTWWTIVQKEEFRQKFLEERVKVWTAPLKGTDVALEIANLMAIPEQDRADFLKIAQKYQR